MSASMDDTNSMPESIEGVATDAEAMFKERKAEWTKTGYLGNLTPQQDDALTKLRAKLFDPAFPFAENAKKEHDGDRFFLRFLRATMKDKKGERLFDPEEAFKRLANMYKWRKEYDIDELQAHLDNGTVSFYDCFVTECVC
jgi:hypothetical protein